MTFSQPLLAQDVLEQFKATPAPGSLGMRELVMICGAFALAIVLSTFLALFLSKKKKRGHSQSSGRRHGGHRRSSGRKNFASLKETGGLPPRRQRPNPPETPS